MQPAEHDVHPGDEFQRREDAALADAPMSMYCIGSTAHCGMLSRSSVLLIRPVRDCAEGGFQVEVGDVGGGILTIPLFIEACDQGQGVVGAETSQEAGLNRADGRLSVPRVLDVFSLYRVIYQLIVL